MKPLSPSAGLAVTGLAGLALFSTLFTIGDALGVWPAPPGGALAGTDLVAGLLFGLALLASLVRGGGR